MFRWTLTNISRHHLREECALRCWLVGYSNDGARYCGDVPIDCVSAPAALASVEAETQLPGLAKPSGQLRYQLLKIWLGPGSGGAAPYISQRAEGEREFGDVVSVGCVDD